MNGLPDSKPEAVLFDWDGTLVDSLAFLTGAHNKVRQSLGIGPDLTKEEFHYYLGMPRDVIFRELYGKQAEEGKAGFAEYYNHNHLKDIHLIDGAEKLLQTLARQNIPMGVVSNKRGDFLRAEVAHLGWDRYFKSKVVGAGDTKEDKPSPVPLLYALSLLPENIENGKIWYVGDTEIDLKCANAAKIIGILYKSELSTFSADQDAFMKEKMPFCVKKYEEFCCFLLQSS